MPLSNTWTRYSTTYSALPVNTSKIRAYIYLSPLGVGNSIDISYSAIQLEKGSFATSFIPTTTVNFTRNADVVTIPATNISANSGTVLGVWSVDWTRSADRRLLDIYNQTSGPNRKIIGTAALYGQNSFFLNIGDNGVYSDNRGIVYSRINNTFHTDGGRWSGTTYASIADSVISNNSSAGVSTIMPTPIYVGSRPDATNQMLNGSAQRITIYSSALSDADINTVTNAIKDGP